MTKPAQITLLLILLAQILSCGSSSTPTPPDTTQVDGTSTTIQSDNDDLTPDTEVQYAYTYSFDSLADQIDPLGLDGSAEIYADRYATDVDYYGSGSWDGGSFLRITLLDTTDENDTGIFIPLDHLDVQGIMSIGWISRLSLQFLDLVTLNKMAMMRVGDGDTVVHIESPQMIISGAHENSEYSVPQISARPSNDGRKDENGREYPNDYNDAHTFKFEDYANQWVYYEIVNNTNTGFLGLYVYTRDGYIAGVPLAQTTSVTQNIQELYAFRFVGYLWAISGASAESYADIADLYVADHFMGPPAGFVLQ